LTARDALIKLDSLYCSDVPWFTKKALGDFAKLFDHWQDDPPIPTNLEITDLAGRVLYVRYETGWYLPPLDPDEKKAEFADEQWDMM
jgi:hypothetical protein